MKARDEYGRSERDITIHQIALFLGVDDSEADKRVRRACRRESIHYKCSRCIDLCTKVKYVEYNYITNRMTIGRFRRTNPKGTFIVATLDKYLPFITIIDGKCMEPIDDNVDVGCSWRK